MYKQKYKSSPEQTIQRKSTGTLHKDAARPTCVDSRQSMAQTRQNKTGLPDNLKSGIERLSGYSMDDVRVHYHSAKPAQLQAHAYAQGTNIYLGSGQEKHLPHEAWHVVQQKQGRVKPTLQMKGKAKVNDNADLEREADVMGEKALQMESNGYTTDRGFSRALSSDSSDGVLQLRRAGLFGLEAEVAEPFIIGVKLGEEEQNFIGDPGISFEEYKLGTIGNTIDVTLDNEVTTKNNQWVYRKYAVEFIQKAIDVLAEDASSLQKVEGDWGRALDFWKSNTNDVAAQHLLKGIEKREWYQVNPYWKGNQFNDTAQYPGITRIEGQEGQFNWLDRTYNTYINAKTADPEVSVQLTAGTNLEGFSEMYSLTLLILGSGKKLTQQQIENDRWNKSRKKNHTDPMMQKYISLLYLLAKYVENNSNINQRYAKEYISILSRTSLDQLYAMLDDPRRNQFKESVSDYVFGVNSEKSKVFVEMFRRESSERVFKQNSSVEPRADQITIEQMLLSITKQMKSQAANELVDDPNAEAGDIFSQNNLAGISEIHTGNNDKIKKYGLAAANEMTKGEVGIIFESRAAKLMRLSEMGNVFKAIAIALQQMERLDSEAKKQVEAEQRKASWWKFW